MPQLVIPTKSGQWVIPEHHEIVKVMITQKQLQAVDLRFDSNRERQSFVKRLALLALADECQNRCPSVIADLVRYLVAQNIRPNQIN